MEKNNEHKHELIMACVHVLEENKPIGDIEDEIKDSTIICQKCIDKMCPEGKEPTERNLPDEVHLVCKYCIVEKLRNNLQR